MCVVYVCNCSFCLVCPLGFVKVLCDETRFHRVTSSRTMPKSAKKRSVVVGREGGGWMFITLLVHKSISVVCVCH